MIPTHIGAMMGRTTCMSYDQNSHRYLVVA
jgi:hypothetical protein